LLPRDYGARLLAHIALPAILLLGSTEGSADPAVVAADFVFQGAPFRSCHASTLAEISGGGLVASWFGGDDEGKPNVGIWVSRKVGGQWSPPIEVVNGIQPSRPGESASRYPCWNPVLYQLPGGDLFLFYKVGPSPRGWWGMMTRSSDGGVNWSTPARLPDGILGPIKNKPVATAPGRLLAGSSTEHATDGWRVHVEFFDVAKESWSRGDPLNDGIRIAAIQPSILQFPDGRLELLCRDRRLNGRVFRTWSADGGNSWSRLEETLLPNPNSGLDAISLKDGTHLLVYNHSLRTIGAPRDREVLNVAISPNGVDWEAALVLENETGEEFSYPAVIQGSDGLVHICYTWKRLRIRHVVIDPSKLSGEKMRDGRWPWEKKGFSPLP